MTQIPPKKFFTKVTAAREALRNRADELINEYIDIAKQAKASQDYESAYKALQWLIEHLPKDEQGQGVVDRSADKEPVQIQQGETGPRIQIGIALGGVTAEKPKELPVATVEVIDAKSD